MRDYEEMLIMDFVAFQFTLQFLSSNDLIQLKEVENLIYLSFVIFDTDNNGENLDQSDGVYYYLPHLEIIPINNFSFGGFVGSFLRDIIIIIFLYLSGIVFETNFVKITKTHTRLCKI